MQAIRCSRASQDVWSTGIGLYDCAISCHGVSRSAAFESPPPIGNCNLLLDDGSLSGLGVRFYLTHASFQIRVLKTTS